MIEAMLAMAIAAAGECPRLLVYNWGTAHLTESYFVARVDPMPAGRLTYSWSVDKGRLRAGATPENASVIVDLAELSADDVSFDLTVEIGGLPKGCPHRVTLRHTEPRFEGVPERGPRP